MLILYLFFIPIIYTIIKLVLYFIIKKTGKISYDGFSALSFSYDSKKDIFYSLKNAWQKNFGYSHLYDVGAPLFRMIMDTEPIRFFYNDKNWLITFWKGQYGIVTGAEIGIYATNQKEVNKKTLYLPISESELLDMSFVLYKNGKEIIRIHAKHWWLATFKLGMFSKPRELSMQITLNFPNKEMLDAFIKSFLKKGYTYKDFKVVNNSFYFHYKKPKSKKVWTRTIITDSITQALNHKNVRLYDKYLSDIIDNNKIDDSKRNKKLIYVNELIPSFLKNSDEDKKIVKDLVNNKAQNIIFFTDNIYSNLKK